MAGYKIALIVACIDETYQKTILKGISESASEYSLNIETFISFIGSMGNPKHDKGEFNIFNLPDFSRFDGAILLTNTIDYKPVASDIIRRIKESGIPAVSMDNDIDGLYHIGIDNKTAMKTIAEHLVSVHNYRKFCYISGPKDNPESVDRLDGFLETMSEHGISVDKDNIYFGDFRAPSGTEAVEYFLNRWNELPDAIVCANDVMATSAIKLLIEKGYRIPEDIAVTGFDNTYFLNNFQVELTSIKRPFKEAGRLACQMLFNHFNNVEQERSMKLNMQAVFTESCGCKNCLVHSVDEIKKLNNDNYIHLERTHHFMSLFNKLSCELLGCSNFSEYIDCLKKAVPEFSPEEFYFCVCENWEDDSGNEYSNKLYSVPHNYTDYLYVPIAYKQGIFYENSKTKKENILPDTARSAKTGRFYFITPLHFGERCLGYMIILNPGISPYNTMFETLCINLSNSLENIRKLLCLESAVKRLNKLYTVDTFSNIYNRNGFIKATQDVYKDCIINKRNIMLMFIDLDGLKKINDTYGHDIGDMAIRSIADIIRTSCTDNEVYCRFGGDEFIIFAPDYSKKEADELKKSIEYNIMSVNNSSDNPFELSASTGYIIATPSENEDIFNFVTEADKVMYEEKRRKKQSRYLKS